MKVSKETLSSFGTAGSSDDTKAKLFKLLALDYIEKKLADLLPKAVGGIVREYWNKEMEINLSQVASKGILLLGVMPEENGYIVIAPLGDAPDAVEMYI